jgi:uncharacterized repeat protein (TIGR03803 family)
VFSVTTSGVEKIVYSFQGGSDGADPEAALTNVRGTLYGTTYRGATSGNGISNGTVFSVTPAGTETVVHSFRGGTRDGANPVASLIEFRGNLFGTTTKGGTSNGGTVFRINLATGRKTILHKFSGSDDGADPQASLINVGGLLYGTTEYGGKGLGTVFSVTTAGAETVLDSLGVQSEGPIYPAAGLINVNGTLYGTTVGGGYYQIGTVFSVTPSGTLKLLHFFEGGDSDGSEPVASLINVKGTLYGTTATGGAFGGCGTIFSITKAGAEKVVYSFHGGSDGAYPDARLIDVGGTLYGTTTGGGSAGNGTVFALTP